MMQTKVYGNSRRIILPAIFVLATVSYVLTCVYSIRLDIVFPVRIEREDGVGTTNLWPSGLKWAGRNRRDALGEAPVVYQLSGFGVDYELQMAPNEVLLSPSAFVQTIDVGNAGSEEILTEEMVDEGCHLHGWVFEGRGENSRQWGQAAISVCDGNMVGVLLVTVIAFVV